MSAANALRFDPPPGTHIDAATVALVGRANMAGAEAIMSFNGVELRAMPGDDAVAIASRYNKEMADEVAAWRKSPKGQAQARAHAAEIAKLQALADTLVERLSGLDFTDRDGVLAFLGELQPCTDRIGVTVKGAEVLTAFAGAGLTPNMCVGADFLAEDEEAFFRWLVGQALDGLDTGPAIHGVFHKFAGEWRGKWGRAPDTLPASPPTTDDRHASGEGEAGTS